MDYSSASFLLTFGLIVLLVQVLSYWQVFTKAGYEGWKSIIPIYNVYILTKIGEQPVWIFIMMFLPFINLIALLLVSFSVAKAFGKGPLFAIFGLMIFQFFGYMYLGWGQSKYVGMGDE